MGSGNSRIAGDDDQLHPRLAKSISVRHDGGRIPALVIKAICSVRPADQPAEPFLRWDSTDFPRRDLELWIFEHAIPSAINPEADVRIKVSPFAGRRQNFSPRSMPAKRPPSSRIGPGTCRSEQYMFNRFFTHGPS